jgi:lipoate-protein ligase A
MNLLNLTLPSPAENLACDEALLDVAEAGQGGEVLRFWESPEYFVVVGYTNKAATEVNVAACAARGIPILRRCSGGGTVVQGPGCLNYALVLQITEDGPTRNISAANQFIMERNRSALARLTSDFRLQTSDIQVRGHTDLALGELKFSGNSQRRRKKFLLFHGTFLLDFNLALVSELLRHPSQQPDYRARRAHGEFITNLNVPANSVKAALCAAWDANESATAIPAQSIHRLVADKYSTDEWNLKF